MAGSELESLCRALEDSARPLPMHIQELRRRAVRLRTLAAEVRQASRRLPEAGDVGRVVRSLHEASVATEASADSLEQAVRHARAFVQRTLSGAGERAAMNALGAGGVSEGARATSVEEIKRWIGEVNPGYTGDPFHPRSVNCGNCAVAVFNRLSGRTTGSAGLGPLDVAEMEAATGKTQVTMTPVQIREALIQRGPGSHAVVGVDRKGAAGHWFNAYYDGNEVVTIDGQSGTVSGWPPEYGSNGHPVVHWDAGI